MATESPQYRRLPGVGRSWNSIIRLYQAADHLLLVESSGWDESYKRFYFRDIQGFVLRENSVRTVYVTVFASLAFVFGLVTILTGVAALWGFVAAGVLGIVYHVLRGPTCVCHVRSAVQMEKVPTWRRLFAARKALAQLQPLIEQYQGAFLPGEFAARVEGIEPPVTPAAAAPAATPPAPPAADPGPVEPPLA